LQLFRKKNQRASRVNIVAAVPCPHRSELAICAIMFNEEAYIEDWIRFHVIAGVRNFILYDNNSTDRTVEIVRSLPGINVLIIPWVLSAVSDRPKMIIPQQIMAYCHAIGTFGADYRWMAFIDIDEYLVPINQPDLNSALGQLSDYSNISLPWVMFGPSGHEVPPDEATPFAYSLKARHQEGDLLNFKCIIDPSKVSQVSVHKFQTTDMREASVNTLGFLASCYKNRTARRFLTAGTIQLNHYYSRSLKELSDKLDKGAVSGSLRADREKAVRRKVMLIEKDVLSCGSAKDFLMARGINSTYKLRGFDLSQ
jgi:hypothetical protein